MSAADSNAKSYDSLYREFDSPLMRRLRSESYGEDIGQHSWVTAEELRGDIPRLRLSPASRLLDLGCGPCGPLLFVMTTVGCSGTGMELSAAALEVGRARAAAERVEHRITLREADLNEPLPVAGGDFESVMSLDVVLHLRDRVRFFREVARALVPGGRFLFTDAGVVTGAISEEEVARRSAHGYTQFCVPGFNEQALERAGFRLLEAEDRTASVVKNATGRLAARLAHEPELRRVEGDRNFDTQQRYLETVIDISRRGAVSRMMYVAQSNGTREQP